VAAHIKALQDTPPNYSRGGRLQVLLSPATVGCQSGFMGALTLAPGETFAEHYHPYSDEFLYVVRGTVLVDLDGVRHAVRADQSVFIPRSTRHRLTNAGECDTFVLFQLAPLAPRPELGHVATE
jgi:putative monooxygenase